MEKWNNGKMVQTKSTNMLAERRVLQFFRSIPPIFKYLRSSFQSSIIPFFRSGASLLRYSNIPFFRTFTSSFQSTIIPTFHYSGLCLSFRADTRVEITPRISVSEVYDDNIYLDATNEESDYLTTVSPGINLTMSSQRTSLSLDYSPTWVWYDENDQNDTVRHAGTVDFAQQVTQHVRFNLTDTYVRSEEPLETAEEIESARSTRNTYQRNTGTASATYQFGPENTFDLGFRHSYLENEDPALDDGTVQNPFANMTYWFDMKNGFDLNYGYTTASFSRDDGLAPEDDYDGNEAGIRYIHRFSRQTRVSAGYDFTNRSFEGATEDYKVHEVSVDLGYELSSDLSLNFGIGRFWQHNDISENETGYTYDALLEKRFSRGSFTVGGSGGWDEAYLEAERRGFTRFWSANTSIEYRLLERLSCYAGASLRHDKDSANREWETIRANGGLRLGFLRWFSAALDYSYAERDDDINTEDYKVNRVMLTLTATKPERL